MSSSDTEFEWMKGQLANLKRDGAHVDEVIKVSHAASMAVARACALLTHCYKLSNIRTLFN